MIACSTSVRCASTLEIALSDIAGAGFAKVDILAIDGWAHVNTSDLVDRYDDVAARVDRLLVDHRLTPLALNTGVGPQLHDRSPEANLKRQRETDAVVRMMRSRGIGVAAIQPRNAASGRPWEDVLQDCVASLREQVSAGEAAGVAFALELHVRSPFETLDQARSLLAMWPEVPLVYDPTHFVMQGIPIEETGWLMGNARHVHLRDAAPGSLQASFGEGTVNFDWLLAELRGIGYKGHFSIEYLQTDEFDGIESSLRLYDKIAEYFPV